MVVVRIQNRSQTWETSAAHTNAFLDICNVLEVLAGHFNRSCALKKINWSNIMN